MKKDKSEKDFYKNGWAYVLFCFFLDLNFNFSHMNFNFILTSQCTEERRRSNGQSVIQSWT